MKKNTKKLNNKSKSKRRFHFPLESKTIIADNYAEALKILKGKKII